jgi:hypothetical protein
VYYPQIVVIAQLVFLRHQQQQIVAKKQRRNERDKIIAAERSSQNSPQHNCALFIARNQKRFAAANKTHHSCNASHLKTALIKKKAAQSAMKKRHRWILGPRLCVFVFLRRFIGSDS